MGYVDIKDTSQNICTWKHKIRLLCMYVCLCREMCIPIYMCVSFFFKEQNTLRSVPCMKTDTHSHLLKTKPLANMHLRDIQHGGFFSKRLSFSLMLLLVISGTALDKTTPCGSESLKKQAQSPERSQAVHQCLWRAWHLLAAESLLEHHFSSTQADSRCLFQIMDCGAPAKFLFRVLCTAALCALSVWGPLTSRSVGGRVRFAGDVGSVMAVCWQQSSRRSCLHPQSQTKVPLWECSSFRIYSLSSAIIWVS